MTTVNIFDNIIYRGYEYKGGGIIKIYIVYRGEFETDKPRNYMATPEILLTTKDKNRALQEVKNTKLEMSNWNDVKHVYNESEYGFEYDDDFCTYGMVGIIEEELV